MFYKSECEKKGLEYLIAFYNGSEISVIISYQMWLLKASGVAGVLHEFQLGPVIESRIHLAGQSSRFHRACFTCTTTVAQQHRTKNAPVTLLLVIMVSRMQVEYLRI